MSKFRIFNDLSLSEKRAAAGRAGARARWGSKTNGNLPSQDGNQHPNVRTARPVAKLVQGRNGWYRITNQAADTAEIYIYDEIGFWGVTADDFVRDLRNVTAPKIDLHLNTPGGDVFDGVAIYQALKDHSAEVTTYVDALAASAGSFIAQAGDRVVMKPNAQMMIHKAMGICVGNDDDMTKMRDMLTRQNENIAAIYTERAGGSVAEWIAAMQAETWYTADEAVSAGLADEVAGSDKQGSTENSFDLSVFNYAGRQAAPAPTEPPSAAVVFNPGSFAEMMKEALA